MRSGSVLLPLRCAGRQVSLAPELERLAQPRTHLGAFRTGEAGPAFEVRRATWLSHANAQALTGSPAPWAYASLQGDAVDALIPDDMWAAESVLRLTWQHLTLEQGGVLMHGCGVAWSGRGVAAIGRSGAGKSTLAALCSAPPGNAQLLTDEIVQLMPDGLLYGTPFRSNVENVGQPGPARLESLLLLEKGSSERVDEVAPAVAATELFTQLYWVHYPQAPPLAEARRRVLALIERVGVRRLTFRKDAAVGPFLREWVASR